MDTAHQIWRRGRMRSTRAIGGGGRLPIASYQAVLFYLAACGPTPIEHLSRDLAVPQKRMHGRMLALWDYGFVSSADCGRPTWRLTPAGHTLARALRQNQPYAAVGIDHPDPSVA